MVPYVSVDVLHTPASGKKDSKSTETALLGKKIIQDFIRLRCLDYGVILVLPTLPFKKSVNMYGKLDMCDLSVCLPGQRVKK
jgi:hypothetical protein